MNNRLKCLVIALLFHACYGLLAPSKATAASPLGTPFKPEVTLQQNGFYLNGQARLLRGGGFQWFRIPPAEWEDRLQRFKAAGFNTLDLYIPWRLFEPVEGHFDFKTYDIVRFLELVKKYGLMAYFRPGPYITNEMDGGGVPAWVFTKTSKSLFSAETLDGTMNLRTEDADFMAAVDRYWSALIPLIRPYLYTQGGPIILFGIENEYTWFKPFFELEKLSTYLGKAERDSGQKLDRFAYLGGLRDIALHNGIDVPIATCPGQSWGALSDEVPGILPLPNYYTSDAMRPEYSAFKQLRDMHDAKKSSYVNVPSGSTETERTISTLRRQIMGGLDAVFHFNIVGSHQEGRLNALVINPPGGNSLLELIKQVTDFSLNNIAHGFVKLPVAYFHGVQDYYGAVSASGNLNEKFHAFRRTNLFFDSFENLIAEAGETHRTSDQTLEGEDKRIVVRADSLGMIEPDSNKSPVHYWLELKAGAALLGLLNNNRAPITVDPHSIEAFGETLPKYSSFIIPTEAFPGNLSDASDLELQYDFLLPIKFPLLPSWTLDYSTSEILKFREGKNPLLILYGVRGGAGELRLRAPGLITGLLPSGFLGQYSPDGTLTFTYEHRAEPQHFTLTDAQQQKLDVLVLDMQAAGRTWFPGDGQTAIIGPRLLSEENDKLTAEVDARSENIWSFGASDVLDLTPLEVKDGLSHYRVDAGATLAFHLDLKEGRSLEDSAERDETFPLESFIPLGDRPEELEKHGIYEGHAWYRSSAHLTAAQVKNPGALSIESASDFVGIYVNGHYLLTLAPVGTAIDSGSSMKSYRFKIPSAWLKVGVNTFAFRMEIWGHGSFLWPRGSINRIPIGNSGGHLPLVGAPNLAIPGLGFDSLRGLSGAARLGTVPLVDWQLKNSLSGEAGEVFKTSAAANSWAPISLPLKLSPGAVTWYRTLFRKDELPDARMWQAPLAFNLKGHSSKATLYLNGRLIGRWLSDTTWMQRGAWTRPFRDMWMNTSPDAFPFSLKDLKDGENDLVVLFEDTSDQTVGESTGTVDSLSIELAAEAKSPSGLIPDVSRRLLLRGQRQTPAP